MHILGWHAEILILATVVEEMRKDWGWCDERSFTKAIRPEC